MTSASTIPDPKDRHVLATAIRSNAQAIVTFNIRDFPEGALSPLGIEAKHPDDFVLDMIGLASGAIATVVAQQASALKAPPVSHAGSDYACWELCVFVFLKVMLPVACDPVPPITLHHMCGRYGFGNPARLSELNLGVSLPPLEPRYNVAPTQDVPVIYTSKSGERRAQMARWGLVPYWADDPSIGSRMINARGDTVRTKPAFKWAFKFRRALMPADLFYEWQALPGTKVKQPWCIRMADDAPFAFGALMERWKPKDALAEVNPLMSCAIITTEPNELMEPLHDRMPVIIKPENFGRWLDPDTSEDDAATLIKPYDGAMRAFRVSRYVNAPQRDDIQCIQEEPVET